jgi:hypothetical protein
MPTPEQQSFLGSEIFSMTLAATVRRSRLYNPSTTEKVRKPFQDSLHAQLENFAPAYRQCVTEDRHLQNIERLSSELSDRHKNVLAGGVLRIGAAQKALNLYLKYLWCLGEVDIPPHCPIDSVVLKRIRGFRDVRWTQISHIDAYIRIIEAAKAEADGIPLALWELSLYNKAT